MAGPHRIWRKAIDPVNERSKTRTARRSRHRLALAATALLALVIAFLTLTPQPVRPPSPHGWDKLYHLVAFAALAFPAALLYTRSLVWVVPAALLFGGAIELIQPHVGRSREIADFLADGLGVGIGVILGLVLRSLYKNRAGRSRR